MRCRMAQAIAEDAAGRRQASIASCTGWGLQREPVTRLPGELLPRLSILTARRQRFLSVALSWESPPPAVSWHPCPVVPGLSSYPKARDRLFTSYPRYPTPNCRFLSMDPHRECPKNLLTRPLDDAIINDCQRKKDLSPLGAGRSFGEAALWLAPVAQPDRATAF